MHRRPVLPKSEALRLHRSLRPRRRPASKRLPTWALIRVPNKRVALDVMLGRASHDWLAWTVEVYDAAGRHVVSKLFTDVLAARNARQS